MNDNETIADIIAEKRALADGLEHEMAKQKECKELMIAHRTAQAIIENSRREADRLEAAHRREKSEWVNANAGLAKFVDIDKVGDCAKLLDAHWVGIKYDSACCSKCGAYISTGFDTTSQAKDEWGNLYPYCPYCGAQMDLTNPFEEKSGNKKTK